MSDREPGRGIFRKRQHDTQLLSCHHPKERGSCIDKITCRDKPFFDSAIYRGNHRGLAKTASAVGQTGMGSFKLLAKRYKLYLRVINLFREMEFFANRLR
ncbi:hypothetical protein GF1_27940 [Desulfolithobacter dissulfuricans]|uniref:Uncharacterized protein n=1 Tax=Desulfolithobacter dissulfuricans TaxID=2795293 RepID=A0A915U304_9BACT|nr:hypothetical protein GF1_27940 [Desulfolithobacter dissulfuricans]